MGPQSSDCGNLFAWRDSSKWSVWLQWGRSRQTAETYSPGGIHRIWSVPLSLQWGRSRQTAETAPRVRRCCGVTQVQLQWGRSRQTAENLEHPGARSIQRSMVASMGPQSSDCGNHHSLASDPMHETVHLRFNGAAVVRLRKRGIPESHVGSSTLKRFNGAAVVRLRKHSSTQEAPALDVERSFNGAAVVRLRKPESRPHRLATSRCFNGAAVVRLRKLVLRAANSMRRAKLQWGRSRQTAETHEDDPPRRPLTRSCFNGAAVVRLRKPSAHRRACQIGVIRASFNGAAVVRLRKLQG